MSSFKSREVISILQRLDFVQRRQTGSHVIMYSSKQKRTIPVPMHNKDLKKGTLRSIIKQADSTEEEFLKLK